MAFFANKKLFTSSEVCHACGISKTSLFRLEECGFLKPYYVNPDTGYRYYNLQNITAVGQYQMMQEIGLSKKEITDVFHNRVDGAEFLRTQRQRLARMQRFLDEYESRIDHKKNNSGSFVTLSAVTCYCTRVTAHSLKEAAKLDYLAHEKCVDMGYKMHGSEPLFGIIEDRSALSNAETFGLSYTFCIPLAPDTELSSNIRYFPETPGFSLRGFGDFSVISKLEESFWNEVDKRNLSSSEPARFIMHIGSYAGAHYKPDDYCYEYVLPIKG
ncbi:MerR family transcriptional regulator [Lachnospiraceae bacterium C1.1]|nr:MerR family transcriptional regulator [Lachnospiraceae bacterium C1.1]